MSAPQDQTTPFELVFDSPAFDHGLLELLREQAALHGAVSAGETLALPAGGELLRQLLPESAGASHRQLMVEMGALLFHAFRYWLHGRVVYEFAEHSTRALLTDAAAAKSFRAPAPAGYVRLARNCLWARSAPDMAPEPVHGFFWSAPEPTEGARANRLDLLLCLGMRAGRPGLTVVSVSLEGVDLAQWADVQARPDGNDFDNILPGGELQGYHALTTHAEVVKLAVRAFRYIDTHADSVELRQGIHHVANG